MGEEILVIVSHCDKLFADPSLVPSFAVARLAGAEIEVVLNGYGADEVFVGYRHFIAVRQLLHLDRLGGAPLGWLAGVLTGQLHRLALGQSVSIPAPVPALIGQPSRRALSAAHR